MVKDHFKYYPRYGQICSLALLCIWCMITNCDLILNSSDSGSGTLTLFEKPNLEGKYVTIQSLNAEVDSDEILAKYNFHQHLFSVCVNGLWILHSGTFRDGEVAAVSGTNFCTNLDMRRNLTFVRPVEFHPSKPPAGDQIYLFRKLFVLTPYSELQLISNNDVLASDRPRLLNVIDTFPTSMYIASGFMNYVGTLSQVVVIGRSEWSLFEGYDYTGRAVCVRQNRTRSSSAVQPLIGYSICCLNFTIRSARKGCRGTGTAQYDLRYNVHRLVETEGTVRKYSCTAGNQPGHNIATGLKFYHALGIAQMGLAEFQSVGPVRDVERIVQRIFDILYQRCDPLLVPVVYFKRIGRIFVYYLDSLGDQNQTKFDFEKHWTVEDELLTECIGKVSGVRYEYLRSGSGPYKIEAQYDENGNHTIVSRTEKIDLVYRNTLDPIIETVWHAISTIFAVCPGALPRHRVQFMKVYGELITNFLLPFQEFWKDPGPCTRIYDQVLGQFGIRATVENTRSCMEAAYTQERLSRSPRPLMLNLDGLEVVNDFLQY